jgi:hypothetical protein
LDILRCDSNLLITLDVSSNTSLEYLNCRYNKLRTLNVKNGNNTNMTGPSLYIALDARNNPDLFCIEVDNVSASESYSDWYKDASASYSEDCSSTSSREIYPTGKTTKIFPNPVIDIVTINTNDLSRWYVSITSLTGHLIANSEMQGPTHQVDLSSFEKGLYFITIRSRDYIRTEKIIKQ